MSPRILSLSRGISFRAMRFGALSVASFLTNIAVTYALTDLFGAAAEAAFLTALSLVFFINFACCRRLVFQADDRRARTQLASFFISTVLFRAVEYAAFLLLYSLLGVDYLASVTIVLITGFWAKFLFYSRFVFNKSDRASTPAATNYFSVAASVSVRTDSSVAGVSVAAVSDAGRTPASR